MAEEMKLGRYTGMTTLSIAFGLALFAIAAIFASLSALGVEQSVAASIATAIIGGVPQIRELLDKHLAAQKNPQGTPILSLGGFELTRPRLILYGTLMIFSAMQLASGFGGVLGGILNVHREQSFVPVMAATYLVVFPTVFLVGRWVGRRSVANGLVTIFLIGLLARIGATLFDMMFVSSEDWELMLQGLGEGSVLSKGIMQVVFGAALFFTLGTVGYWRGRRHRLGSYLGYLLRRVPDTTQRVIVELAFEEATRASKTKSTIQQSSVQSARAPCMGRSDELQLN
jgi:hypothetical protein